MGPRVRPYTRPGWRLPYLRGGIVVIEIGLNPDKGRDIKGRAKSPRANNVAWVTAAVHLVAIVHLLAAGVLEVGFM